MTTYHLTVIGFNIRVGLSASHQQCTWLKVLHLIRGEIKFHFFAESRLGLCVILV